MSDEARDGAPILNAEPPGYWLGEDFRHGFTDDPSLPVGWRRRVAAWCKRYTPEAFTDAHREALEAPNTGQLTEVQREAERLGSVDDELPPEELARFYQPDPEIERQMRTLAEREDNNLEKNLPPWALSVVQTADELGVSEEEVRALIADKKLGAIAGRIITRGALASYVRRRDLEQFPGPELTDPWEPDQH